MKKNVKESVIDKDGNLWIKITKNNSSIRYIPQSPNIYGLDVLPSKPYIYIKRNKFFAKRGEQWRQHWYHEWDFNSRRYCTGKPFDKISDVSNYCSSHESHNNLYLVYYFGRVYYANFFINSDNFMLFNPYTLDFTGVWTNAKNLQPIFDIDKVYHKVLP